MSTLRELFASLSGTHIALETTSGKLIAGEVALVGGDFLAVKVHPQQDAADVVPFTSVAELRAIPLDVLNV